MSRSFLKEIEFAPGAAGLSAGVVAWVQASFQIEELAFFRSLKTLEK